MSKYRFMKLTDVLLLLMIGLKNEVFGELSVRVAAPTVVGSKAVVGLELQNGWTQSVESARATLMLLDEQGKLVGQSAKWVIGGNC